MDLSKEECVAWLNNNKNTEKYTWTFSIFSYICAVIAPPDFSGYFAGCGFTFAFMALSCKEKKQLMQQLLRSWSCTKE